MALPSQELLNKYRAEEKSADQDKPANPEQTNAETTGTETETQPTGGETQGEGEATTEKTSTSSDSNGAQPNGKDEDRWAKTQANFEKRLHRQERSHRRQLNELNATIADLRKQLEAKSPKLQREDFPTLEAFENYRKEELKKEILEDQKKAQEARDAAATRDAEAQKRVEQTFRTPEQRKEFNEVLTDFLDDNAEWLETEEGQLYQEIIDQSPIGLVMAMAIGKNEEVQRQMKTWSKDLLYQKLLTFENALLQKAKEQPKAQTQTAQPTGAKATTPTQPSTSGIPSTGSVGKTQAAATFNAREWLKKNRPQRYPIH